MINWTAINKFSARLFGTTLVSVGMERALDIASDPDTRPHWDSRSEILPGPFVAYSAPPVDKTDLYMLGWTGKGL